MSVKRYDVGMTEETNSRTGFYASYPRVYEAEQGRYVEYEDYARLKAEVEELKLQPDALTAYLYAAELGKDAIKKLKVELTDCNAKSDRLKAEVERLRKACELVFDESAKRKFLMCYRGNDFYVSKEAMEAMSVALGYSKAKEGKPTSNE